MVKANPPRYERRKSGEFREYKDWPVVVGGESVSASYFYASLKAAIQTALKERMINRATVKIYKWKYNNAKKENEWKEISKDEFIRQGVSSES